jgi:DNA adenine methylase
MLAKLDRPEVDVRKPYTKIGGRDCFSGRHYDEEFVGPFITKHKLPCNSTTAFLTPTLRNMDQMLDKNMVLVGRPETMYQNVLQVLDDVHANRASAQAVLDEIIRHLWLERKTRERRLRLLLENIDHAASRWPLSAEETVALIEQHLHCKGASRLPVLVVAAAYQAAAHRLAKRVLHLASHNAADAQTGAVGDVQITLLGDDQVVTSYEMKNKLVQMDDIDRALQKIAKQGRHVRHYIFITTEPIKESVIEYARAQYDQTGGIEIAVLDCIGFLRHFLHLFHELRQDFLDHYQTLLLNEPDSAVSQPLKEVFLALRKTAETNG